MALVNVWGAVNTWAASGSAIELTPTTINSNSQSFNPSIDYTSALILSPATVNSSSISLNPFISNGATQDVGTVTAGFGANLYSVKYQLSNITVSFRG